MNYINVLSILTGIICISTIAVQIADARKCYICGEGADGPFKTLPTHHGQSSVPIVEGTCEDFRPEEKYEFECPPTFTSCLTQVDGDIETRTCGENLAIDDCKSANSIDYCYCSKDLCNHLTRIEIRRSIELSLLPAHHRTRFEGINHQQSPNSDDEDLLESSGMDGDHNERQHSLHQHHQHHREMLHNGKTVIAVTSHQDATTQITIPISKDRPDKGSKAPEIYSNATQSNRSRESNTFASSSSSSGSIPIGQLVALSCIVILASLKFLLTNVQK